MGLTAIKGALVVVLFLVCILGICAFSGTDDVVINAGESDSPHGRITIPAAGVDMALTLVHDDSSSCCYLGLWNGGRVNANVDLSAVRIGDMACIAQEYSLVLECVEVVDCITIGGMLISWRGIVRADGDILLCDTSGQGLVIRVYRWVRL